MKQAQEAELATALYWCESVIHWMCESRWNAAVVQHVRVIPARLLNLDSHKVIVYGYFSIVKYKALQPFAFSPFVIFVNVSAQEIGMEKVFQDLHIKVEKLKFVTRSSIKEFVLYLSLQEADVHFSCGKSASHSQGFITLFLVSWVFLCEDAHLTAKMCVRLHLSMPARAHVGMSVNLCVCVCVHVWYSLPKTCCSPAYNTHHYTKDKVLLSNLTLMHPSKFKSGWLPNIPTTIRFLQPLLSLSLSRLLPFT